MSPLIIRTLISLLIFIFSVDCRFINQGDDDTVTKSSGILTSDTLDLRHNQKVTKIKPHKFTTQQYCKGLKIFDAKLVVREDEDGIKKKPIFGNWFDPMDCEALDSVEPTITIQEGFHIVRDELSIGWKRNSIRGYRADTWIYPTTDGFKVAFIYRFQYEDLTQPDDAMTSFAVVHAQANHEILKLTTNILQSLRACGNAGNDKIGKSEFCGTSDGDSWGAWIKTQKPQTLAKGDIIIYNKKYGKWNDDSGTPVKCNTDGNGKCDVDPYETTRNGGYGTAIDAYYNAKLTFKMYNEWMGQPPVYWPKPFPIYVHVGWNWVNAHYLGDRINVGDGDSNWHPFVALDIIAHELGHGYTHRTADLIYSDESGAMDEAYSDMTAVAAHAYSRGGTTQWKDFKIGYYDARPGGAYDCIRWMHWPKKDGYSLNTYCDYKANNNEVHSASGIYNRAVFWLNWKSQTRPWSMEEIFKVWSTASKNYWFSRITMRQGVCGIIQALHDVYGSRSDVDLMETELKAAFAKVKLSCDKNLC
eukprot:515374_1